MSAGFVGQLTNRIAMIISNRKIIIPSSTLVIVNGLGNSGLQAPVPMVYPSLAGFQYQHMLFVIALLQVY